MFFVIKSHKSFFGIQVSLIILANSITECLNVGWINMGITNNDKWMVIMGGRRGGIVWGIVLIMMHRNIKFNEK